ncbi:hypothetical protein LTR64_001955 [Lithohypha guttulata]|uniref:uncharacterized protein n=1 Tax=Lithohypha guttulata TaxID=1690604 RepID=UPI00315C921B
MSLSSTAVPVNTLPELVEVLLPKSERPRKKAAAACTICKHKRRRCTGGHDDRNCDQCRKDGLNCKFEGHDKRTNKYKELIMGKAVIHEALLSHISLAWRSGDQLRITQTMNTVLNDNLSDTQKLEILDQVATKVDDPLQLLARSVSDASSLDSTTSNPRYESGPSARSCLPTSTNYAQGSERIPIDLLLCNQDEQDDHMRRPT